MLHPDSNYRSSQVSMRNNMKLQLSEQRGDIVDISVSTTAFWQLRAINWQRVEIIVTNEQQLATTRPTHWIWLTHTHTYRQAHTQTDTETDKHIHRHIQRQTSTQSHMRAKGLWSNAIHSEIRSVYGDKCFTRPTIHVCWWVDRNLHQMQMQSAARQWGGQQPTSLFAEGIQKLVYR